MAENEIEHVEVMAMPMNAIEAQERATIDMQISTAKRYPRNITQFYKDATNMIKASKEIATSCVYRRPVGKDANGKMKYADGLRIRMAEIALASYGNLRVATRIVDVTPRQVTAQGIAFDLEKNIAVSKDCVEATVKKNGVPYDERMRLVVAKAAQSKALRDAVFGVIPKAMCEELRKVAEHTALGGKTLDELRPSILSWIKGLGIKPERVWDALDIGGEKELTMDLITVLGGIKTALDDNEITINEAFPLPQNEAQKDSVTEKIKDHFAGKKTKPKNITPQTSTEPESAQTDQAPVDEKESEAGSGELDPTPPEVPANAFKCLGCGHEFDALKDGKCPNCFGKKVAKL